VDRTRALAPEAIARTLACLGATVRSSRARAVTAVDVVGTSAMRDAAGGDALRARATELLGVEPRTSGDEEAELTFLGALSGLPLPGDVLVFDVGGGSTEIIVGEVRGGRRHPRRDKISLDVGSVRLTERHVRGPIPPSAEELDARSRGRSRGARGASRYRGVGRCRRRRRHRDDDRGVRQGVRPTTAARSRRAISRSPSSKRAPQSSRASRSTRGRASPRSIRSAPT
jgi:hypothetical protein